MEHANTDGYLTSLSQLTTRSFGSTQEATEAILRMLTQQLGMRTSFLAHIERDEGRHEILAAHNLPGGCGLVTGDVFELSQTF